MKTLPRAAQIYLSAVVIAAIVPVVLACIELAPKVERFYVVGPLNGAYSLPGVVIFLLIAVLSSLAQIPVPEQPGNRSSHSLNAVGVLSVAWLFPFFVAVPLITMAGFVAQVGGRPRGRRRPTYVALFNVSSYALQVTVVSLLFQLLGGSQLLTSPDLPSDAPRLLLAIAISLLGSYIVSYGLTIIMVSLRSGLKPLAVFRKSHRNTMLPEATAASVGILLAYTWKVIPPLAPVVILPIAVIYVAFQNYIRLQELDLLKSNFIAEISHELRTPLSAILASSELLYHHSGMLTKEDMLNLSRRSYEGGNHLVRIVENMLNASTLDSGTLKIKPVSVSMDELVDDALVQVQPFLDSKEQRVICCIPNDLPEVLADPAQIVQVMINILTNASKYSGKGTLIQIVCTPELKEVRVAVKDEGIGIAPVDQSKVFDRFYRVPSNTMSSVVGSGLGLTIVKSLVEMHEGRVGLESNPGVGSMFWFTLPTALSGPET